VEPIPENGRLVFFADLRPDLVEADETDGVVREVVALAIFEAQTIRWDVPLHHSGRPLMPDEILAMDLGEGEPGLVYYVLELEAEGRVVDDWVPGDLGAAKAFLQSYPGAVWEELPDDTDEALALLRQRLAGPPRR
jgi:hypothetical protein